MNQQITAVLPSAWAALLALPPETAPRKFSPTTPLIERVLWRSRVVETGCWIFEGAHDSNGYGVLRMRGTNDRAHRIVHTAVTGPIPTGSHLDHLCRVTSCCNPGHLEVTTVVVNTFVRAIRKSGLPKATHCSRGHVYAEVGVYVTKGRSGRHCRVCAQGSGRRGDDAQVVPSALVVNRERQDAGL